MVYSHGCYLGIVDPSSDFARYVFFFSELVDKTEHFLMFLLMKMKTDIQGLDIHDVLSHLITLFSIINVRLHVDFM